MGEVSTIGIDIANSVFQVHGVAVAARPRSDIGQRLLVAVANDEAGIRLFGGAGGGANITFPSYAGLSLRIACSIARDRRPVLRAAPPEAAFQDSHPKH